MNNIQGTKIWIVGASVGIGEALTERLAAAGAHLILSARSVDKIKALAERLPGSPHFAVSVDVTDQASVDKAWASIAASCGTVDTVIYNAGTYEPMSAKTFDLPKVEDMIDVNFSGALRVLSHILPAFIKRKTGHIILVASVAGYSGLPNAIGYGASKAALQHLAENLRADLRKTEIKVQMVNPGFVKTRLTEKNHFPMPFIISPDAAADYIFKGMTTDRFDIHFPKRFSFILKFLRCLPYPVYFRLIKNL